MPPTEQDLVKLQAEVQAIRDRERAEADAASDPR